MKKRIINIASYEKPTFLKKLKGLAAFLLISILILGTATIIPAYEPEENHYHWNIPPDNVSYTNLSAYFGDYQGSFVLYDLENNIWNIHGIEQATLRVSPNSTYKIYNALFGLEDGIITPENSLIKWNGEEYPFKEWNDNQTLQSAMRYSVNWYFQALDRQLGAKSVNNYIQKIKYGNRNISTDLSTYWLESSLKISPVEQVELLIKLHRNDFGFAPENINAVKNSICLSSSKDEKLYGKTGTGRVDGQSVNGWFVGYIETDNNTFFFATNIKSATNASGSNAMDITMDILSDMDILD